MDVSALACTMKRALKAAWSTFAAVLLETASMALGVTLLIALPCLGIGAGMFGAYLIGDASWWRVALGIVSLVVGFGVGGSFVVMASPLLDRLIFEAMR